MIICKNCKAQLDDSEQVCRFCGTPVDSFKPMEQAFFNTDAPMDQNIGKAGYSDLIDSEEVVKAIKKNKRITGIALVVMIFLPIIGFLIYGAVSPKMEIYMAAVAGVFVSLIFVIATVIYAIKQKAAKPFEGTVADKKITREMSRSSDHAGTTRTKYRVYVNCDDGKRRKKEVTPGAYEYLQIGERVRYLPQFPQPFEKYDKRPDGAVLCMFCSRKNSLAETNCAFCHKPLIK